MKFSYNWLQSFFDKPLPKPDELAELLTLHSFEVEEVLERSDDYILDIDILPNRASDCLSHWGLAREIAALLNYKLQNTNYKQSTKHPPAIGFASGEWRAGKAQNTKFLSVEIADKDLCPRYSAYVIEGVRVGDSPDWIKERLGAMGQKAINNVVDITNYVIWESGQPLHAFDFDKIQGAQMNIRLSRQGEKLETLDGVRHDFGDDTIIIEDAGRIIDLAGVKGGASTQIDSGTTRIIFQAAIFDPSRIRRASQKLGVKTEAAVRYMHGFDKNLPPIALDRAMALLLETSKEARILQKIDFFPTPEKETIIELDVNYANNLLGAYLSIREMRQILERLGFFVKRGSLRILRSTIRVSVPSYRLDVRLQEDLIEEIGRVYGYENIKSETPHGALISPRRNEQVFWRGKAREILAGFGFSEVYNYSLIPSYGLQITDYELLELANPVSDGFKYLRPALWPGVLKNISLNQKFFDGILVFEIGKVFFIENDEVNETKERENVTLALVGSDSSHEAFYQLKGYLSEFFNQFGVTDFYLDPALSKEEETRLSFLHPGKRANVILDGNKIGYIGEMHPDTLDVFGVEQIRVFCAELDFEKVVAAVEEEHIYQSPSKYPEVVRDIAILVPRETMVAEVLNLIETIGGPLLRDTDLFDMYEGENLPEGVKNLAFHLIFQSDERTLTSQEIDEIMAKIINVLEDNSWEVR